MSLSINQITNCNIYIDGASKLGKAKQIKLPDIEIKTIEHNTLGMIGTIELPSGLSKLEAEITWDSFYSDVFAKAYNPFKNTQLQVRANVSAYDSTGKISDQPLVMIMNVSFKKNPLGDYKPNEQAEFASTATVHSVKQSMGGKEILFYDAFTNIYRVNGVDVTADYRQNIGQ